MLSSDQPVAMAIEISRNEGFGDYRSWADADATGNYLYGFDAAVAGLTPLDIFAVAGLDQQRSELIANATNKDGVGYTAEKSAWWAFFDQPSDSWATLRNPMWPR